MDARTWLDTKAHPFSIFSPALKQFMSVKKDRPVPVFRHGQDATFDPPCKIIPHAEARQLKKQGRGYFISHGRAMRLCDSHPIIDPPELAAFPPSSGAPIGSTISFAEMKANAGIVEDWEPIGTIRRAQYKVRMYPVTGDTHAPLARAYS